MDTESISVFSLFLAGLLSLLTPSGLLLVPPYLTYLSASHPLGEPRQFRNLAFLGYALTFMGGFTLFFVILFGMPISLGTGPSTIAQVLTVIGGILLMGFAVYVAVRTLLQLFQPGKIASMLTPMIERTLTVLNCIRSIFFGMVFAAIWTPIIGPVLGAVLTLAVQGNNVSLSVLYLLIYSIGLATSFVGIALLWLLVTNYLRSLNQYIGATELFVSAFVLFIIGLLLLIGVFSYFNAILIRFTPAWFIERM
jgi:cytochrome c-type biogenesis protein